MGPDPGNCKWHHATLQAAYHIVAASMSCAGFHRRIYGIPPPDWWRHHPPAGKHQ